MELHVIFAFVVSNLFLQGGSFKTLLQRPGGQSGCSKGGGVAEQQRGHCNRILNIQDNGKLDGVMAFLF